MDQDCHLGNAFAQEGPKYFCPHCTFPNPLPEKRWLEGVSAVLCKRCQQSIPIEIFNTSPDQE